VRLLIVLAPSQRRHDLPSHRRGYSWGPRQDTDRARRLAEPKLSTCSRMTPHYVRQADWDDVGDDGLDAERAVRHALLVIEPG
jgi:hypothetical protein